MKVNLHCLPFIPSEQIFVWFSILGHIILTIKCWFSGKRDMIYDQIIYTDLDQFTFLLNKFAFIYSYNNQNNFKSQFNDESIIVLAGVTPKYVKI